MKNASTVTNAAPVFQCPRSNADMLKLVKENTLQWFFDNTNEKTGLVSDRNKKPGIPASIAATGFAFYCYPIAVESGLKTREEGAAWAQKVLHVLVHAPDGEAPEGNGRRYGMYYHMLDPATGLRATKAAGFWDGVEVSTIDTALLAAGALFARNYFDRENPVESEIRQLATELYENVDWTRFVFADGSIGMGWTPQEGMIKSSYKGYSEDLLLYILALGSQKHQIPAECWQRGLTSQFFIEKLLGMRKKSVVMHGMPLFCYQYPQLLLPFQGVYDDVNRSLGMDYCGVAAMATDAHWRYVQDNPMGWRGYDKHGDLLTACDGLGDFKKVIDGGEPSLVRRYPFGWRWWHRAQSLVGAHNVSFNRVIAGKEREFRGYSERGIMRGFEPRIRNGFDDGTVAATATIGSLPFPGAARRVLRAMRYQLTHRSDLFDKHGFADAHNDTLGWVDPDKIGIDQGPIVIAIQEYLDGFVSRTMRKDPSVRRGFIRAGFTRGWLDQNQP